jgi:energy-coupling factor transporter ATP-binding protein EcfA2
MLDYMTEDLNEAFLANRNRLSVLVGDAGTGKSTLLRSISAAAQHYPGRPRVVYLEFKGSCVTDFSPVPYERLRSLMEKSERLAATAARSSRATLGPHASLGFQALSVGASIGKFVARWKRDREHFGLDLSRVRDLAMRLTAWCDRPVVCVLDGIDEDAGQAFELSIAGLFEIRRGRPTLWLVAMQEQPDDSGHEQNSVLRPRNIREALRSGNGGHSGIGTTRLRRMPALTGADISEICGRSDYSLTRCLGQLSNGNLTNAIQLWAEWRSAGLVVKRQGEWRGEVSSLARGVLRESRMEAVQKALGDQRVEAGIVEPKVLLTFAALEGREFVGEACSACVGVDESATLAYLDALSAGPAAILTVVPVGGAEPGEAPLHGYRFRSAVQWRALLPERGTRDAVATRQTLIAVLRGLLSTTVPGYGPSLRVRHLDRLEQLHRELGDEGSATQIFLDRVTSTLDQEYMIRQVTGLLRRAQAIGTPSAIGTALDFVDRIWSENQASGERSPVGIGQHSWIFPLIAELVSGDLNGSWHPFWKVVFLRTNATWEATDLERRLALGAGTARQKLRNLVRLLDIASWTKPAVEGFEQATREAVDLLPACRSTAEAVVLSTMLGNLVLEVGLDRQLAARAYETGLNAALADGDIGGARLLAVKLSTVAPDARLLRAMPELPRRLSMSRDPDLDMVWNFVLSSRIDAAQEGLQGFAGYLDRRYVPQDLRDGEARPPDSDNADADGAPGPDDAIRTIEVRLLEILIQMKLDGYAATGPAWLSIGIGGEPIEQMVQIQPDGSEPGPIIHTMFYLSGRDLDRPRFPAAIPVGDEFGHPVDDGNVMALRIPSPQGSFALTPSGKQSGES